MMTSPIRPRATVLLAFAIVGLLNAQFILNHFYVTGAYLLDSGLFAGMLESRGGLRFLIPTAIIGDQHAEFWSTHFSPTVLIAPALHNVLHVSPVVWLAIVMGFIYGLLALAVCWLLILQTPASVPWLALSLCGTLAFLWGRPVLLAVSYPHFEFLFIGLVLLFGIAHAYGRRAISLVLLTLAIGVREDCGFHFFAIAATYLVLTRLMRPLTRAEWVLGAFAIYAFCWSVLAITVQKASFPGDNALARIYLGHPPLAHLTSAFVVQRLATFVAERYDVLLMWGWLIALAAMTRSLAPLAGVLAFLPWTILNVLAVAEGPATLGLYYGFPLTLGFVWPLLDRLWQKQPAPGFPVEATSFVAISVVVAIAGAGWLERQLVRTMLSPSWIKMSGTREFADWLESSRLRDGVVIDASIASLAPWRVDPRQVLRRENSPEKMQLVVYNPRYVLDKPSVEAKADAAKLSLELAIPRSTLIVRSATPIDVSRLRETLFE